MCLFLFLFLYFISFRLIDLISPTVTAALAGGDSPPPVKKSRSNCRPKYEQDMRHLLANAYSYKSVLLQRDDQVPTSLTYSRLALQLNTGVYVK